jgi:DNA-binding transcriptional regulator YbjK
MSHIHSAAGAVFHNQLITQLRVFASDISSETTEAVLSSVKAIFMLPPDEKAQVIKAYVAAVDHVFLIGVPGAALASLAALLITRNRIVAKKAVDGAHTSETPEKAGP